MEVFELRDHPYFLGCQFHPEFKSRPTKPSPLFVGLLHAASGLPSPGGDLGARARRRRACHVRSDSHPAEVW